MVNDNPLMSELERMADFCKSTPHVFIYQLGETQKLISKYLAFSGLPIAGFIKPEVYEPDRLNEIFPIYTFAELARKFDKNDVGIILSVNDTVYSQVMENFELIGVHRFFPVSNWNKRTIAWKMRPRPIENFFVEVNLADHCNLNCQCCDHFSPIADEKFYDFNQYSKDIKQLSKLTNGRLGLLKFEGGEPFLNKNILNYFKAARDVFQDAPMVVITNGMLLTKLPDDVFEVIKQNDIEICMTHYPISINIDAIIERMKKFKIETTFNAPGAGKVCRLNIFSEIGDMRYKGIKQSTKHPFDLSGRQETYRWISCYHFNECITMRDGKIYTCPIIPYSRYFNKYFKQNLPLKDDCYIDIYHAKSFEEIAEFCTHRVSFCDYCAVQKRHQIPWNQSACNINEWV